MPPPGHRDKQAHWSGRGGAFLGMTTNHPNTSHSTWDLGWHLPTKPLTQSLFPSVHETPDTVGNDTQMTNTDLPLTPTCSCSASWYLLYQKPVNGHKLIKPFQTWSTQGSHFQNFRISWMNLKQKAWLFHPLSSHFKEEKKKKTDYYSR